MSNEYRLKSTGEIKTRQELKKDNPNISLPKVWNNSVFEVLGIDPVFETPKPTPSGDYKTVVRNDVEQDANENWVQAWIEKDMFSDTDEATKEEQEIEYQARLDSAVAKSVRADRDQRLKDTDWMGLSDVTMSTEWATYRQELRDVPEQAEFPNTIIWPVEPS